MKLRVKWLLLLSLTVPALLGGGTVLIPADSGPVTASTGTRPTPRNIVYVIIDDWGIDQTTAYYASATAITPNINARIASGIKYTHMTTAPSCAPMRSAGLSGRLPKDTGVGSSNQASPYGIQGAGLDASFPTYMQLLQANNYRTVGIGKWHLNGPDATADTVADLQHTLGFDYWEGTPSNPGASLGTYTNYIWCQDTNTCAFNGTYLTTYTTDRAIAMLPPQGPFMMYVAYNAPHNPLHCPPDALTPTYDAVCTPIGGETATRASYHAMLEALDTELERFLDALNLTTTTVIVVGDNGTPGTAQLTDVIQGYSLTKAKASVYLGGIRTPLFAFGNLVTVTGTSAAVVQSTDLARTFLDIAGISQDNLVLPGGSSISFYPTFSNTALSPRTYSYTEKFDNNQYPPDSSSFTTWDRSAESAQYHLVRFSTSTEEFYDIVADQFEATNLCSGTCPSGLTAPQLAAYNKLKEMINNPLPGPSP